MAEVQIKPLKWENDGARLWSATCPHTFLNYAVMTRSSGLTEWRGAFDWTDALSVEAGKQSAQADYESRIRSALLHDVSGMAEPGEWKFCPECGSFDIWYSEGHHKQCKHCHQEWFSDIDYADVCQKNLPRMFRAATPASDLREANEPEIMRYALDRALGFIGSLTADPLLMGDDIEMRLEDVQAHARIELASIRKQLQTEGK